MSELRWNPLLGTWTIHAANRQGRPQMPRDWCPFCPGSGRVPESYDVLAYDNDFPPLTPEAETPPQQAGPYESAAAYGKAEVILYSPRHDAKLWELSLDHLVKLVELWRERCHALELDPRIKYTFPFENRGEEVGVTMPHPHGQLYAFGFVPLKVQVELDNARRYFGSTGECVICAMTRTERSASTRVIAENTTFISYLPYFTDYPYGAFIVPKRHLLRLSDLRPDEIRDLAELLRSVVGGMDRLFDRPLPYMMCIHQGAVNTPELAGADDYYHFHIEFYPPLRSRDRIKWYASAEMGAWAATNPRDLEECAAQLRDALMRFAAERPPGRS